MYRPYMSTEAESRPFRDVESQIRGLSQDFAMSFNTGNYDQAAALFAGDGVCMAPHHEPAHGQKAVERLLRQLGEAGYENLRLETTRVENSGEMAMEVGRYSLTIRHANGKRMTDRGKYVKVWRRLGVWLVVADSWNSSLPIAETSQSSAA
jgi:ketosteroid isomerase-like protein